MLNIKLINKNSLQVQTFLHLILQTFYLQPKLDMTPKIFATHIYSFLELARPPTKPLSTLRYAYGGVCLFFKSSSSAAQLSSFKFTFLNVWSFLSNLLIIVLCGYLSSSFAFFIYRLILL